MCSSRAAPAPAAPSSTAEISTAGTTRTPWRSPAASASETPLTVSWSDSASSSTPASAAQAHDLGRLAGRRRSGWSATAGRSEAPRAGDVRDQISCWSRVGSSEGIARQPRGRAGPRRPRMRAHGGVVAAGLARQRPFRGGVDGVEIGAGGLGLGGALAGLDPENLQVGQGRAQLLLGERRRGARARARRASPRGSASCCSAWARSSRQTSDRGEGWAVVGHAERPCSVQIGGYVWLRRERPPGFRKTGPVSTLLVPSAVAPGVRRSRNGRHRCTDEDQ